MLFEYLPLFLVLIENLTESGNREIDFLSPTILSCKNPPQALHDEIFEFLRKFSYLNHFFFDLCLITLKSSKVLQLSFDIWS